MNVQQLAQFKFQFSSKLSGTKVLLKGEVMSVKALLWPILGKTGTCASQAKYNK